jgi:hypothetical protein
MDISASKTVMAAILLVAALLFTVVGSAWPQEPVETLLDGFAEEPPPVEELLDGFAAEPGEEQEEPPLEELLDGFVQEAPGPDPAAAPAVVDAPPPFSIDGHLKVGATWNVSHESRDPGPTDWRGLSGLDAELSAALNGRLGDDWRLKISGTARYDFVYDLRGRDNYTRAVLNHYPVELELGEAWLQGRLTRSLDIKTGRQIVVWGRSDTIRVTDVLNPLDVRQPGITDIEDLRLPAAMTRLDYYFGNWTLSGIAVHEIRFNTLPEYGSDFYPASVPLPEEKVPSDSLANTEWALALTGVFSGWDISLYCAELFEDLPHTRLEGISVVGPPPFPPIVSPILRLHHARLTMLGAAGNFAVGNWLFKAEAAWFDRLRFFNLPQKRYSRTDLLVGAEYSGFTDTTVSLEVANRHTNGFEHELENDPDNARCNNFQSALRVTRTFLNERLEVTALAQLYGLKGEEGAIQRLSAEYELTDAIRVIGGMVLYQNGDVYDYIGDNDRLFMDVVYSF